jgi:hypothetical protein
MTRNDAITCISIALHEHAKPADPIEVAKAAVNIATALDALGLLNYAAPPVATSNTQERSSPEEIDAAARIVSGNPLPDYWASRRSR